MILPGCLLVLLLPAGGAVLGHWLRDFHGNFPNAPVRVTALIVGSQSVAA
jgi:hypothetical protein